MAEEKELSLEELLFGAKSDTRHAPDPSLAQAIQVCYRESRATLCREHGDQGSTLPRLPEKPMR